MNMSNPNEMRALATVSDPRWASVLARDAAADGRFFYSVRTTGVYCRPSCAARSARPENVEFHATTADAERAGFRPCKRCKPDQPARAEQHAAAIADLCRFIERSEQAPTLDDLAGRAGWSTWHLHRLFKEVTGVTPKAYATAHRASRVRQELARSDTVTDAIYDAGYNSNGRFYERSNEMLGMTPTAWRAGGANTDIRFAIGECALGAILVAQSERGVCAIALGDDPDALARDLQDQFPQARLIGGDAGFEELVAKVVGFVEAPGLGLDLPLDVRGTAFQQRVWQALREIPIGATASYSDIAKRIGAPKSMRAVAQACGANTLAVAIPCHRVVRSDGSLSGYRWGVERKSALLRREAKRA
ncbi:bifunctional DNA-binding transcriptional regulator/O6-methylguanine-DNA methyltransferase Ada [Variovorax sp. J22R24]|uniref:bifunctional DNA-binding transcriptional regulator/O6-methylguanine-DNA methyltransferase Ada n=1 Tax=Variovorax gracilis TaxID=3053502 RepID=UPI00257820DB|nr:bifunctional DNA-binding transcriptional regulator/O6-methylguanine-DNA methyltransferase Ada [Variovorax sp. J22R24]MDM0104066.1 bifunctional DNA-binding transcriptional regulator/O6-methylguanine-DNA methyltransferase Ada [Variovorax sp. J22R24]